MGRSIMTTTHEQVRIPPTMLCFAKHVARLDRCGVRYSACVLLIAC